MRERNVSGRTQVGPGRPREFDENEALAKIMGVFWRQGYEGTGLSDLLVATGLAKASLYSAFGNKRSMYLRALTKYEALMVDSAVHALRNAERPARERIEAFLHAPIGALQSASDRRGCFLCNASADQAALDGNVAQQVQRGYAKMLSALAASLAEQYDNSGTPLDPASGAALAMTIYSGLRIMVRAGVELPVLERAKDAGLTALFG